MSNRGGKSIKECNMFLYGFIKEALGEIMAKSIMFLFRHVLYDILWQLQLYLIITKNGRKVTKD